MLNRVELWNPRLGEFVYFTVGIFPRFVYWIISSILMVILTNLIVYYAIGKKSYKSFEYRGLLNLFTYIIMIFAFPNLEKTFLWMGSIFNHVLSIIMLMIIGIPYRNEMDNEEFKFSSLIKFFGYLILVFLSGFGSEFAIVVFIIAMIISNIKYIITNKKINIYMLLPLIVLLLGFVIFLSLTLQNTRFQTYVTIGEYQNSTHFFNSIVKDRLVLIIVTLIITAIYLVILKFSKGKEILKRTIMLVLSSLTIFMSIIVWYYIERAVVLFDIAITILLIYEAYEIIAHFNSKKIIIILYSLIIAFLIYLTIAYTLIFIDYNEYSALRHKYICENAVNTNNLLIPVYDGKEIMGFSAESVRKLTDALDFGEIDSYSISVIYGLSPEQYTIDYSEVKLR